MIISYIQGFKRSNKLVKLKDSLASKNLTKPLPGLHLDFVKNITVSKNNLFEGGSDLFTKKSSLISLYVICCTELFIYSLYHNELENALITIVGEVVEKRYALNDDSDVNEFYKEEMNNYTNYFNTLKIKRYDCIGIMSVVIAYAIELDILEDLIEL